MSLRQTLESLGGEGLDTTSLDSILGRLCKGVSKHVTSFTLHDTDGKPLTGLKIKNLYEEDMEKRRQFTGALTPSSIDDKEEKQAKLSILRMIDGGVTDDPSLEEAEKNLDILDLSESGILTENRRFQANRGELLQLFGQEEIVRMDRVNRPVSDRKFACKDNCFCSPDSNNSSSCKGKNVGNECSFGAEEKKGVCDCNLRDTGKNLLACGALF